MIRKLSVSLLMLVAIVSAMNIVCQAQSQTLLTRHVRDAVRNGEAKPLNRLPATQSMRFDVVLALRHQPELKNFLQELYDPSSSSYKQFVTPQEFTARFGPSQEDYDALIAFAKASGFTVVQGSRDAFDVQLNGTVGAIEKALHVTMGVLVHTALAPGHPRQAGAVHQAGAAGMRAGIGGRAGAPAAAGGRGA